MAIFGTYSIQNYPLVPGATTSVQNGGISGPTFSTAPVQGQVDTVTVTIAATGNTFTWKYRPTMMTPGNIIERFLEHNMNDAFIDDQGRLVLPSASALSGTSYLGF